MANLSIYVDGKFWGHAAASAQEVALHTDEKEYDARHAAMRFGSMLPVNLHSEIAAGHVTGKISVRDENRY